MTKCLPLNGHCSRSLNGSEVSPYAALLGAGERFLHGSAPPQYRRTRAPSLCNVIALLFFQDGDISLKLLTKVLSPEADVREVSLRGVRGLVGAGRSGLTWFSPAGGRALGLGFAVH